MLLSTDKDKAPNHESLSNPENRTAHYTLSPVRSTKSMTGQVQPGIGSFWKESCWNRGLRKDWPEVARPLTE